MTQLLEPGFQKYVQGTLWNESPAPLRYVVKLHDATRLHYDFRIELYSRLFSWSLPIKPRSATSFSARRVGDHNLKYLLSERRIPQGQRGAGPTLVWDHGIYHSPAGGQEEIYRQLERGDLEIELEGIRLSGRARISGSGEDWTFAGLPLLSDQQRSVLTGRSLEEIGIVLPPFNQPFRLGLDWEHYYAERIATPQVVIERGTVFDMNFEAERRGVAVGMRLQHALPLVPSCQVKERTADPERQKAWLDLLVPYTDVIQPIDEHIAVVDLSAHPDPCDIAGRIVHELTSRPFGHLRYGAGTSQWLAQLATQQRNPYGYIPDAASQLAGQPVEALLSIPRENRERLIALGFGTVGAVAAVSLPTLLEQFGENAHAISIAAQGKTRDQVLPLYPPHAIAETHFFETPVNDSLTLQAVLNSLAKRLAQRMDGRQAAVAALDVALEDGAENTLRRSYNRPAHTLERIQASLSYLGGELQKHCPDIVRVTAKLDQLEPINSFQRGLFTASNRSALDVAVASLRTSLGKTAIVLASQIEAPRRKQVLKAWRNATGWD